MHDTSDSPVFDLDSAIIRARAQVRSGRFFVLTGSEARVERAVTAEREGRDTGGGAVGAPTSGSILEQSRQLQSTGALVPSSAAGIATFTRDTEFTSASEATAVLMQSMSMSSSKWVATGPAGERITYGAWRDRQRDGSADSEWAHPRFELKSVGLTARAEVRDGRFTVLPGSQARRDVVDSFVKYVPPGYRQERSRMIETGVLRTVEGDQFFEFSQEWT